MHPELSENFAQLSQKREQLLSKLESTSPEILQYKSNDITWSPTQILNHLILAEQLSLGYIIKKFPAIESVAEVGIKQRLALRMMKIAQKSPNKYKAPQPVSQPEKDTEFSIIKEKWEKVQSDLALFLNEYPDHYIRKALYKHPFIGRISLGQMMQVNVMHIERHERQIDQRIKNFTD